MSVTWPLSVISCTCHLTSTSSFRIHGDGRCNLCGEGRICSDVSAVRPSHTLNRCTEEDPRYAITSPVPDHVPGRFFSAYRPPPRDIAISIRTLRPFNPQLSCLLISPGSFSSRTVGAIFVRVSIYWNLK